MIGVRVPFASKGRFLNLGMLLVAFQLFAIQSNLLAQCQPLPAGTYTVGGQGAQYPSLEAALAALNCAGVQGPVTLQLAAGHYEGRYVLSSLPGTQHPVRITATNTATFSRPVNALQSENFEINGGRWQLEHLAFERVLNMLNPGPLVRILGGSRHRISQASFSDQSADRRPLNQAIWLGQSDSLELDSNVFAGFAIAVMGMPTSITKGTSIRGNEYTNYKGPALQLHGQQAVLIQANRFVDANGSDQSFPAIQISQVEGLQLFNNRFIGAISPSVLHLKGAISNVSLENSVYNNEVFGYTDTLNSTSQLHNRIFWLEGDSAISELVLLAHNSIRLQVLGNRPIATQALLYMTGYSSGVDSVGIFNNIFAFDTLASAQPPLGFRAVVAQNVPFSGILLDHNVYGLPDTLQSYFEWLQPAPTSGSFGQWKTSSGWDSHSVQTDPRFANAQNTLPANNAINNLGFFVPWVTTDFNNVFRNLQPDPGVFEFEPIQTDLQLLSVLQPTTLPCSFQDKEALQVAVRNLGLDSISNVRLAAVLNGQVVLSEHFALNLAAGQTQAIQFTDSLSVLALGTNQLEIRIDSVLDIRPENDTLRLTLRQLKLQQFPFTEDFEALLPGAQQTTFGWRNQSLQGVAWRVQRGPTPTAFTGPTFDGSGQLAGQYLYFDASAGQPGDTAIFLMDCIDLGSLASPQLSYRLHAFGADMGSLLVQQRVAGQWQPIGPPLTGQQQSSTNAAWITRRSFLDGTGDALRFIGIRGNGPRSDWAIDNLKFAEVVGDELVLDSVQWQLDACSTTGSLNVVFFVRNDGTTLITPRVGIQLGQAPPVFRQINRIFQPFDTDTVHFQVPFNSNTETLVKFFAANVGDTDFTNDTITQRLQRNGTVSSFPYFEDFESAGAWSRTGQNSSWQRTQPAALVLNSAFSGASAWVTAPAGLPNAAEFSAIESPCFDFTNLIKPQLSFAIQYLLGDRMAAQLQYSINGGSSWLPLGSLFTGENWYDKPAPAGLNRPGAFWSGDSEGWKQAKHDLSFLSGQASVKFRFQFFNDFDTSSVTSALEGVAVDAFAINEAPGCFVYQTNLTNANHCSAQAHTVSTRVARENALQSIQLRYSVNGGVEVALPMVLQLNNLYTATIPAQNAGDLVQWRIQTQADTLLSSEISSYIDGFLMTSLADVSAPVRSQHTFDAGVATNSAFNIGLAGTDSAAGVWFKIEAKRKLELTGLELQITRFTGVDAYLLGEEPTSGNANRQRMRRLGSARGIMPGGFSQLVFDSPMQLNAGQTAVFLIQGLQETDFRLEHLSQATPVEDNNIRVFPGQKTNAPFTFGNQLALPTARLLVSNPSDSIRWRNAAGQLLANTIQHQRQMPASPDLVVLQLYKNGCVFVDTALFTPSGTIDLGVVALLEPTLADVRPGVFYPVKVAIRNFGSLDISSYTMAYRVNGVELNITPVERLIPAGDTIHYSFPQSWTWVETGAIVFCAYPRGLSLDVQLSNDTLCQARFPTSVPEADLGTLKLYPNPAQGHFWIESALELPMATLKVFDAQGRNIYQQEVQLGAGERQRIDCSSWANGLYHYRLEQGLQHSSGRMILQR